MSSSGFNTKGRSWASGWGKTRGRAPAALKAGRPLSQRLTTALATRIASRLVPQPGRAHAQGGDAYTPVSGEIVVEVVAGTTP